MRSCPKTVQGALRAPWPVRKTHPTPGYIYFSVFFRGFRGHYHLEFKITLHISRFTHWCTECTLRSFRVFPCVSVAIILSRSEMTLRCEKRPAFVFPCSSVDSVAIIIWSLKSPFTFHVSRIGAQSAPYVLSVYFRVFPWPLFIAHEMRSYKKTSCVCISVFFRGFRGHYPSRPSFTFHLSRTP